MGQFLRNACLTMHGPPLHLLSKLFAERCRDWSLAVLLTQHVCKGAGKSEEAHAERKLQMRLCDGSVPRIFLHASLIDF